MADFDTEAMATAPTRHGSIEQGTCATCSRPMYREQPFPGTVVEWKHRSSSHPVSWTPEKHLAGTSECVPHQHRFKNSADGECEVFGCDARQAAGFERAPQRPLTAREAKTAESRRRGSQASRGRPLGAGTGF